MEDPKRLSDLAIENRALEPHSHLSAQSLLYLLLGAIGGAVVGWAMFAGFYIEIKRWDSPLGFRPLKKPVPEGFWRVSRYVALVGALIGVVIVAVNIL